MENSVEDLYKSQVECLKKNHSDKLRRTNYNWAIGVLITIIILILSFKFWGKPGNLENLISIASGLVSIALALTAIIMTLVENLKKNNQEVRVTDALDDIIKNNKKMSRMIVRLDNSVGVAHSKIDATLEYLEKESTLVKGYDEHAGKKHTDSKSTKNEQSVPESSILNTNGFRGKIYLADMSPVVGSEMGGVRPVIVVSNDINNKYSPLMTIVPITSQISKTKLPTHVEIGRSHGLDRDSVVLAEQIRTIDRNRLTSLIVTLNAETMDKIDDAIKIQLGQLDF